MWYRAYLEGKSSLLLISAFMTGMEKGMKEFLLPACWGWMGTFQTDGHWFFKRLLVNVNVKVTQTTELYTCYLTSHNHTPGEAGLLSNRGIAVPADTRTKIKRSVLWSWNLFRVVLAALTQHLGGICLSESLQYSHKCFKKGCIIFLSAFRFNSQKEGNPAIRLGSYLAFSCVHAVIALRFYLIEQIFVSNPKDLGAQYNRVQYILYY